jgi:RecJ-like exonuclease
MKPNSVFLKKEVECCACHGRGAIWTESTCDSGAGFDKCFSCNGSGVRNVNIEITLEEAQSIILTLKGQGV